MNSIQPINALLPVHSLWDGFWIHEYQKGTLKLSGSFNRIYYRDFDVLFEGVTFFNIPDEWRDTDVPGDNLLREESVEDFQKAEHDFNPSGKIIIAIDLLFRGRDAEEFPHTFHIVCDKVTAWRCTPEDNKPYKDYEDPLENEPWPSKQNRVPLF